MSLSSKTDVDQDRNPGATVALAMQPWPEDRWIWKRIDRHSLQPVG